MRKILLLFGITFILMSFNFKKNRVIEFESESNYTFVGDSTVTNYSIDKEGRIIIEDGRVIFNDTVFNYDTMLVSDNKKMALYSLEGDDNTLIISRYYGDIIAYLTLNDEFYILK